MSSQPETSENLDSTRRTAAISEIDVLARAAADGSLDAAGLEAGIAAINQIPFDAGAMLDTAAVPDDAGEYREGLARLLARIPRGWGRWIDCDAGWYPLLVQLDGEIAELAPDYEIHQIKEKFATLRFYWALPARTLACCETRDREDPRPLPGAVTGPWVEKGRTSEDQARMDAWWTRASAHLDSTEHADNFAAMKQSPETARRREAAERIFVLVDAAEAASATICERCGGVGSLHERQGWLKTLCRTCAAATGYQRHIDDVNDDDPVADSDTDYTDSGPGPAGS